MYMTPMPAAARPVCILLIEDNPGDQLLTRKALARTSLEHDLIVISDGRVALDYLFRRGEYENAQRPDLILLDLNIPGVDGPRVLLDVKHDQSLRRIPVIVLTSSEAETDLVGSYTRHANSYMVKPGTPDQLAEAMTSLSAFWFTHSRLSPG